MAVHQAQAEPIWDFHYGGEPDRDIATVIVPGQPDFAAHVFRLQRVGRAHQHDDPRVGDRVHDLLAPRLSAEDAVTITPDNNPFLFQQACDGDHLLGVRMSVADEDLRRRLVAVWGNLTNHGPDSDRNVKAGKCIFGWDGSRSPIPSAHAGSKNKIVTADLDRLPALDKERPGHRENPCACHSWALAYDNVSAIPTSLSDITRSAQWPKTPRLFTCLLRRIAPQLPIPGQRSRITHAARGVPELHGADRARLRA